MQRYIVLIGILIILAPLGIQGQDSESIEIELNNAEPPRKQIRSERQEGTNTSNEYME